MSRILNAASVAAVAMTAAAMLFMAQPGFASDLGTDAAAPALIPLRADLLATVEPAVPAPDATVPTAPDGQAEEPDATTNPPADSATPAPITASSLAQLVAATPRPATLDAELRCLAGAVYFESRGESLAGQLAVAHVVINRAQSGRFPSSLCGVVYQRSQFSFVRGGKMPAIRESGVQWNNAVAIAQIAQSGSWKNQAPGALFFHASRVSPGWRKARVAQIDNHIFYR